MTFKALLRSPWRPSWEQLHFEVVGSTVSNWASIACKGDWPAFLEQQRQQQDEEGDDDDDKEEKDLNGDGDDDDQWWKIPRLVLTDPDTTDEEHALALLTKQRAPAWTMVIATGAIGDPANTVKAVVAIPFSASGQILECKPALR